MMIASSSTVAWVCPNCGHAGSERQSPGERISRCRRCRFIFPAAPHIEDEPPQAPSPEGDETWSESMNRRWSAVRPDRYRVIRTLASGAQGTILLAHHRHLDRRCVIKLVGRKADAWTEVPRFQILSWLVPVV